MPMNEIESQQPETNLADIAWGSTPPLEERRILAKNFEHFVIATLGKGQITSEGAQAVAGKFVELLKSATTHEDILTAIRNLQTSGDTVLVQFGLKAEESYRRFLGNTVYQEAIKLARTNHLAAIHQLTTDFHSGSIKESRDIMARVLRYQVIDETNKLVAELTAAGFGDQANNLQKALAENRVQSEADLASWKNLLEHKTNTQALNIPTTAKTNLNAPSLFNTANDKLHAMDRWLREQLAIILGKNHKNN